MGAGELGERPLASGVWLPPQLTPTVRFGSTAVHPRPPRRVSGGKPEIAGKCVLRPIPFSADKSSLQAWAEGPIIRVIGGCDSITTAVLLGFCSKGHFLAWLRNS